MSAHETLVREFLRQAELRDPETFHRVCARYPTLPFRRMKFIRRREICVGLLGIQPARLSLEASLRYGFDRVSADEQEGDD